MASQSHPENAAQVAAAQEVAPRPTRNWRARLFQGYLVTAVIGFAVLVVLATQFDYFPIDLTITQGVQRFNAPWFVVLMTAVSYLGYTPQNWMLVAVLAGLLFAFGLRWEGVMAAIAAMGGALLVQAVKLVVQRPRPGLDLVQVAIELNSYSFPSGHVVFYTAFFGFLVFLGYTLFKASPARTLTLACAAVLIALVGFSRIYLGNHWASDVTGAYLLGSVWLAACVSLYRWGKPRFFVQQPVAPAETTPAGRS
jgi:undecaprenyl-diphosphatase